MCRRFCFSEMWGMLCAESRPSISGASPAVQQSMMHLSPPQAPMQHSRPCMSSEPCRWCSKSSWR